MSKLDDVEALLLKYPLPLDQPVGSMITYYNPDAPVGYRACTIVFLQKALMHVVHADLPSIAQQKARDYWALNAKWYAPKIDKRRTTDPVARLARVLDKLEKVLGDE